jgi:dienelactone hydrolase
MRSRTVGMIVVSVLVSVSVPACIPGLTPAPSADPPGQAASGPGGSDYLHAGVTKSVYGTDANQYWIFEPASPMPESAPLIVFSHGWTAMYPVGYEAWIEHIVRRGNIVIYPRYQATLVTSPQEFTDNAIAAVKAAMDVLQTAGHVSPQLDRFALVGHSVGGLLTANMAALAPTVGLPVPKAVMVIEPAISTSIHGIWPGVALEDLSAIPSSSLLLVVVGDQDQIAGDADAKRVFSGIPQIPAENKDYVILQSDSHGSPSLVADHYAPAGLPGYGGGLEATLATMMGLGDSQTISKVALNALDYYGVWKLFDGLCDAAFYGKNRQCALGNTPEQRYMGTWSDGVPVKELVVTDAP